jgi:molybdate transport system substrate-binding protein
LFLVDIDHHRPRALPIGITSESAVTSRVTVDDRATFAILCPRREMMSLRSLATSVKRVFAILLLSGTAAVAAEIKVVGLVGLRPVMAELGPHFERATGHKLIMRYGSGDEGKQRIEAGEAFDVAILNPVLIEALAKQGKIDETTRTEIFRNGTGVAGRSGAPKPDIGTVDAFKRALINANSIAYTPGRASGIHVAKILERLGIAEQMKAKTRPQTAPERVARAVAEGDADLGFAAMNLLIGVHGAEVLGPIPSELQEYIVFTAGLGAAASEAKAAKALVDFLKADTAKSVMRAQGLEPL